MTTSSEFRRPPGPSDLAACQKLIRHGSHSFFLASRLLPKSVGVPAVALYAFCRVADDLIDADAGGSKAVEGLRSRLHAMYQGNPGDAPEDRALTEVIHHFEIPQSMLEALLEGLAWDASDRENQTPITPCDERKTGNKQQVIKSTQDMVEPQLCVADE